MSLTTDLTLAAVETRVSEILRELGFGAHETSVIIALNQFGTATVSDLHDVTGIHHANLYSVLEGLTAKGYVIVNEKRPREYQFAPLEYFEDSITSKITQLVSGLKRIQEERDASGMMPALIYTIKGIQDVQAKVLGMLQRATHRILLVCPSIEAFPKSGIEVLNEAAKSGVGVRAILGTKSAQLEKKIKQRIKPDALALNLVVDGQEAMIAMPDFSICGWTDNALISQQFEGFLEQTWNSARNE